MYLILFDVDGTLLHCGPQVRELFAGALEAVYGRAGDVDGYAFAGKTDPQIVTDLQRGAGLSDEQIAAGLPRFKRTYLDGLERHLRREGMRLLPGVETTLERLAARPEVTLALLTGNWERGARAKLARFDLNRFFGFGAFADHAADRRRLPPVALERALQATGRAFRPEQTLIVGDSHADVDAGRANGIPVLAVATGWASAADLEAAGADWVVPDFGAVDGFHPAFAS